MSLEDRYKPLIVAGPGNPMHNARTFLQGVYTRNRRPILIHLRGSFYAWNGTRWQEIDDATIRAELYTGFEPAKYPRPIDGGGKELVKFSPNRSKIANLLEALEAVTKQPSTLTSPQWFPDAGIERNVPADKVIACRNGLLHVTTRRLWPHMPEFFNTTCVPFDYDPDAPTPQRWLTFLKELWDDDQQSIDCLQDIFGYVISGDTSLQKMFLLVGPRRSGKGTIARILTELVGRDHVVGSTLASLGSNFGLAPLVDASVTFIGDARLPKKGDNSIITERMLAISGEDTLTVDRKYRPHWTGKLPARIFVLSNELPRLDDVSGALASRFIILTLTRSFYGRENRRLFDELREELPGILNWALDGLDRLDRADRFVQPESSAEQIRELEDLSSPVGAFIRDCCQTGPDHEVKADKLYEAWRDWNDDQGYRNVSTVQTFGRDLRAAVPALTVTRPRDAIGRRYRVYHGVGLA